MRLRALEASSDAEALTTADCMKTLMPANAGIAGIASGEDACPAEFARDPGRIASPEGSSSKTDGNDAMGWCEGMPARRMWWKAPGIPFVTFNVGAVPTMGSALNDRA